MCVCNCVSRLSSMYSPQLWHTPTSFPALSVWMGITLPSIKSSPSHTLPVIVPSHFLFPLSPFVIIIWQKLCCLSASHWLFDIEGEKEEESRLVRIHRLILLPGGLAVVLSAVVAVHPCQHLRCILSCPSLCR